MGEEPRRSGRATKGQHHKNSEEPEVAPPAPPAPKGKKGKGKGSKKVVQEVEEEEEEEPEAIIRCICGYVEEDPDDKRAMICCDKCSAWQHNICMGLPEDEDDLPEQYFCEQCKPSDHQQTVLALKRGERIWEVRQAQHEKKEEEERQRKKGKKGRKSKGGKPAEVADSEKQDSSLPNDQSSSKAIPAQNFYGKAEAGQKRKMVDNAVVDGDEDEEEEEEMNTSKARKVSTSKDGRAPPRRQSTATSQTKGNIKHVDLQTELVERIEDLHNRIRQRAAAAFVKAFDGVCQQALDERKFKLPRGQNKQAFCLSLGLSVEFCLYINHWGHGSDPNPTYSEKMRAILHNVKANPELRDRLLSQSLSPSDLTQMSSDEMASQELQAEKAQIIKETEKQHILLPETAPKYRKTHKGDELIEDSSYNFVNTESAPQLSTRIHDKDTKEESPDRMGSHSPTAFQPSSFKPGSKPLTVDTQGRRRSTMERKSSSGFDMHSVWSSVDSPSATRPVVTPSTPGLRGPGAKADPEIDKLLGDDEEPYSPADYTLESGMIWRGVLKMPTVADFRASAIYAAGANLDKRHPWSDLIGKILWVEGRIQADVASEYVCNLRWSKTTDVSIIQLTPDDTTHDQEEFTKLFDYFTTRQRWGVGKSPLTHTRDVYVIPLEAGNAPKPEFLNLLEDSVVEDNRANRTLLVVYIIKLTPVQAISSGTPATPSLQTAYSPATGQRGTNGTADVSMSDPTTDSKTVGNDNPLAGGAVSTNGPSKTGREAAEHILGSDLINAPTVAQILIQAPNCGEQQWMHIRECYLENSNTMTDWDQLVAALTVRAEKTDAEEAEQKRKAEGQT